MAQEEEEEPSLALSFATLTGDWRNTMELRVPVAWRVARSLSQGALFAAGAAAQGPAGDYLLLALCLPGGLCPTWPFKLAACRSRLPRPPKRKRGLGDSAPAPAAPAPAHAVCSAGSLEQPPRARRRLALAPAAPLQRPQAPAHAQAQAQALLQAVVVPAGPMARGPQARVLVRVLVVRFAGVDLEALFTCGDAVERAFRPLMPGFLGTTHSVVPYGAHGPGGAGHQRASTAPTAVLVSIFTSRSALEAAEALFGTMARLVPPPLYAWTTTVGLP
eukprot:m51a1_g8526 hypothetical protein (275) ;mRNA; f:121442-123764